eukprot:TRINITY_DN3209_c0_g1_i2.p2 TRINITY_DN3209_c0_g1~~TRINITY_DN3209_c0_g1_i2.p2  ORF type:complete len:225 (+),score=16.27 TRINITY_DN3209_c0_g1_i2:1232-1906(+)
MWLQWKLDHKQITPASALQYLVYLQMTDVGMNPAFCKAMRRLQNEWDRHSQRVAATPCPRAVRCLILAGGSIFHAAVSLQWSTALRHSELLLLEKKHVLIGPTWTLLTIVGGKTDRTREGQMLKVPSNGRYFQTFLGFFRSARTGAVFGGLSLASYNIFLRVHLNCTSQLIRHASLTVVAAKEGQAAARNLARHRSLTAIHHYLPQHLWEETINTSVAAARLQE